jgi:hypothetical protein
MSKAGEWLDDELAALRQLRDELRVQAELGRAEMQERFEHLEKRWHELEAKLKLAREEARADAEDVKAAARLLASEIRDGYRKIKSRL